MKTWKIIIGLAVLGGLGYVAYQYYTPPILTIAALNPLDGSGTFQFGKTGGDIKPGGFDGGWGWNLSFASFTPGQGWTVQITKDGQLKKSIVVATVGQITI